MGSRLWRMLCSQNDPLIIHSVCDICHLEACSTVITSTRLASHTAHINPLALFCILCVFFFFFCKTVIDVFANAYLNTWVSAFTLKQWLMQFFFCSCFNVWLWAVSQGKNEAKSLALSDSLSAALFSSSSLIIHLYQAWTLRSLS